MSDMIGNFLTIIRNGISLGKPYVRAPHSKTRESIAKILKEEGFIKDFFVEPDGSFKNIKVDLKYHDGESVIHELTRVSKPSRRVYSAAKSFKPVIGGLGLSIVSTSKGIMTDKQAKDLSVGGEVICTVW